MRTAVDEFSSLGSQVSAVGVVSGRVARPVHRGGRRIDRRHPAGLRRPAGERRPIGELGYERVPAVQPQRGPHPIRRLEQARIGLATLAVTALLTAAAVCGLLGIAQLRSPDAPAATQTVQVQPGESLTAVAQRVAPGEPVRDTVARIVELNGLHGAEVVAGRTLVVPATR